MKTKIQLIYIKKKKKKGKKGKKGKNYNIDFVFFFFKKFI